MKFLALNRLFFRNGGGGGREEENGVKGSIEIK